MARTESQYNLSVTVERVDRDRLGRISYERDTTVAGLVRLAIDSYLERIGQRPLVALRAQGRPRRPAPSSERRER